ncbi:Imm3 family immunity protein [Paenibacillus dendritiformis]
MCTKGQLTEKEFEELYLRRNRVLAEIEKMPVDLCPKARWFL